METLTAPAGNFGLAGSALAATEGRQFAAFFPQDRILANETHIGMVRELVPPQEHIGLTIAPWLDVASDDVVFDYIRDAGSGMAPARAQDAESQLWRDDELYSGQGRASLIDWAEKSYYTDSDVHRYREMSTIIRQIEQGSFPLTTNSFINGFEAKVAQDVVKRRRRLDNRHEWLVSQALSTGKIVYDDGRIKFSVDFLRPPGQHNQAPASGTYASDTHNPIMDILAVKKTVFDATGVDLVAAIVSREYLTSLYRSRHFRVLAGFAPGTLTEGDMPYALPGWGPQAAIDIVERETGVKFIQNDNVLRTRAKGSKTFVNTRYYPANQVIFLPDTSQLAAYDDTEIGFAKTLTSPHSMNNWQSGYYAWESERTDPWGRELGSGVKMFPVFPHMELTYTQLVTLS